VQIICAVYNLIRFEKGLKDELTPEMDDNDVTIHYGVDCKHAIISICDDEYFEYNIVIRFEEFLEVVYVHDTLNENLLCAAKIK
jgi:hypothetical protein